MKTFYLLFFSLIHSAVAFTQTKAQPVTNQLTSGITASFSIPQFDRSLQGFHLRLKADQPGAINSVVEIIKLDDTTYAGIVWLSTKEFVEPGKEKPTHRVYYSKEDLTKNETIKVLNYFQNSNIANIPTDSAIKGWHQVLDGTTYEIDLLDNGVYSKKSYWSPDAQKDVKEALLVQMFVDSTSMILKPKLDLFNTTIPFESWSDGFIIVRKKVGFLKRLKYRKERNAYRNGMK
jgi:hypothetical protein